MNFREGLRRVGLMLGVAGASASALYAFGQLGDLLTQRTTHLRFQFLLDSPPLRNVARWAAEQKVVDADVDLNANGIGKVHILSGEVNELEMLDGNALWRTEGPSVGSYVLLFFAPVVGFLIPVGSIRLLRWILSGFFP